MCVRTFRSHLMTHAVFRREKRKKRLFDVSERWMGMCNSRAHMLGQSVPEKDEPAVCILTLLTRLFHLDWLHFLPDIQMMSCWNFSVSRHATSDVINFIKIIRASSKNVFSTPFSHRWWKVKTVDSFYRHRQKWIFPTWTEEEINYLPSASPLSLLVSWLLLELSYSWPLQVEIKTIWKIHHMRYPHISLTMKRSSSLVLNSIENNKK